MVVSLMLYSMDPFVSDERGVKRLSLRTLLRDGWGT